MDYKKIQEKLDALNNATKSSSGQVAEHKKLEWKPSAGPKDAKGVPTTQQFVIRILPNFHIGKENPPFLPLDFYYEFGRTWLAPSQFDNPDAIADFYNQLVAEYTKEKDRERNKEMWKMSLKFKPVQRICVPILIRGQEAEGVKFWWFSKKIYNDILAISQDSDYGNIFDLKSGHDITVTYKPVELSATDYPDISVLPKPKPTPVSTDPDILNAVKNMPDIIAAFTQPTFEETEEGLKNYLAGTSDKKSNPAPAAKAPVKDDNFLSEMAAIGQVDDDFDKLFEEE